MITFDPSAGRAASGFGIGALEEYDAEDEDVYATGQYISDFKNEIMIYVPVMLLQGRPVLLVDNALALCLHSRLFLFVFVAFTSSCTNLCTDKKLQASLLYKHLFYT